ncbi:hypothetical protein BURPS406E_G0174 [Burkholderia pseudomallei 406e]|uniref:Uncharacterized protein n=3 Tax=pseudomallei group TaxID=111527 RepID=A2RYC4_BURM9|nr:hypothetical protein BMA10229_0879 [Burkholderia mallei NCTC 10229]ABN93582.1 hypothetical protein BURPS1106A_A1018 [Burkholderia pseudomallei 1106a]ABO02857.1 hypothetical protein BMA10247_A1846 [Burkholderia mallei NCTC 10247]AFR18979.1 hypothetical protein BPC006_II1050 [Burkholderia pseudomallei BPC006]EDK52008.1 hypothetical protein BMAFMH_I0050 [Burkholderia mallei FMH]EDK57312.1 hypothetical protein BMAJHU_F0045 [Burkholderia mallei JHU]EDK82857.1 hypothetical protein BMA721280_K005
MRKTAYGLKGCATGARRRDAARAPFPRPAAPAETRRQP